MISENEKVSIITPFFNSKDVFNRTLESVLSQTYHNWEWIIVDDCSTDGSQEYLKEVSNDDPRICVLFQERNGGSAVARNRALDKATGKYITFLDSDDAIDKNYLESQVTFIRTNGPLITAGYRRVRGVQISEFIPREIIDYKMTLKGNDLSCLTTMYDRDVFGNRRFRENLLRDEDFAFWLEILKDGYVAKTNQNILATYYLGETSKNSRKTKLFKPRFYVYHNVLGYNIARCFWYIFRYYCYGKQKYRK